MRAEETELLTMPFDLPLVIPRSVIPDSCCCCNIGCGGGAKTANSLSSPLNLSPSIRVITASNLEEIKSQSAAP